MQAGGHGHRGTRTMHRTKEKEPSQKMLNEALAAENAQAPPPPASAVAADNSSGADDSDYEEHQHTKVPVGQRKADRAERNGNGTAEAKKKKKQKDSAPEHGSSDDSDNDDHDDRKPFAYTHPKSRVLTDALFMWDHVASFSTPHEVAEVERVCRDVAGHLRTSNKGTRLMQRYWNAQWCRMVWKEEELTEEKRFCASSGFTRAEGKKKWKKMFVEEYPLYLDRTYQGHGKVRNNAVNAAKVLFHVEKLNPNLSPAQLQRMELTEEEARVKEQRKRGVDVEFEHPAGSGGGAAGTSGEGGGGGARPGLNEATKNHEAKEKGRPRVQKKDVYTRADYKEDFRTGARKGKHQKGGTSKWDNYDAFGDYNY